MKSVHSLGEQLGLQVLDTAVQLAVKKERLRFAWIGLVDREHSRVVPVTHAGHEYGYLDDLHIGLDEDTAWGRGPTGRAAREGRPATTYDMARDPDMWPWLAKARSRGYRSGASVPIRRGGVVAAVLNLYAARAGHFDVVEAMRWDHIAEDIGHALDRIDATTVIP
jgi:HTH-type transcriptional regulator, bacterioopsin transcriptional activator and related proteins